MGKDTARRALILLAEDEPTERLLMQHGLEVDGFEVEAVDNGGSAVEAFERRRPALVVLDVVMPVMDGFDTCRALRSLAGGDPIPILMLTGRDDLDSIHRAYNLGATDFASKPVSTVLLSYRVRYLLRSHNAMVDLRTSEARLADAQRIARLGHWERRIPSGEAVWSREFHTLLGTTPDRLLPSWDAYLALIHPSDRLRYAAVVERAEKERTAYGVDLRVVLPDGAELVLREQAEVRWGLDGSLSGFSGTVQDITDRKRAEERIRFLAYHDSLTRLPNRVFFFEWLEKGISRARRQGRAVGVLVLDLDQFKRINDTLGGDAGDRLLQQVATRLRGCLRTHDVIASADPVAEADPCGVTLARPGGDEFLVGISDVARPEDAEHVVRRIAAALELPFVVDEHEAVLSASIGISLFPRDGDRAETLVTNADIAMHHAKRVGWGSHRYYDERMNTVAAQRLGVENGLRKAIERGELELFFQPQVETRSGEVTGVEALVRWRHPVHGLVLPTDFIPVAEETGLILPIGRWVLETACACIARWSRGRIAPFVCAVNVSARQVRDATFAPMLRRLLEQHGIEGRMLELELTEGTLMDGGQADIVALRALKDLGLRIAVDDFGTGYSSLSYLSRLPIDAIKIDQSFVRGLATGGDSESIVSAIVALADSLRLDTIAEGVETEAQRDFLVEHGCYSMQGYLFGQPSPAAEIEAMLLPR